ncbi:hypothetical protein BGW36DRAFT_430438 [Talaromyces proteolyticus]|uniref:Aminoglycoside phosphotransferase domain-containing protein n=1 Tax=Talaromyces proteolyticus TaxID=1131652 RepID=A0AAD4PT53_9EURO|nr:uncharacterized protein BGW36DRAFT_430438 [Talaromyces proteolyticus]KAH8692685.1 hypothetical protein BGW36DRAFT_430438 [Talaromyces proteolyticus]
MRLPSLENIDEQPMSKISHDINITIPLPVHSTWLESSRLQQVVQWLYPPTVRLQNVQRLYGHIHPLCLLKLSNGNQLIIKLSPPSTVPLLRRERSALETEAQALTLLRDIANPFIPQLVHYASEDNYFGTPFLLKRYVQGTSLLESGNRLSAQASKNIDQHLGSLMKVLGQQVSTAFGPLTQVSAGAGSPSWRQSFVSLFEEILRDAEDMFIHLPYSKLREQLFRLAPALDQVTLPRLVIVNFGRPSEVLLDSDLKGLSGILDLGSAIWGDILMAEIFESPSDALLHAFGSVPSDEPSQSIRLLLYSCYRSVYKITELYYHNQNDDTTEMHTRRKLTEVLRVLTETEMDWHASRLHE